MKWTDMPDETDEPDAPLLPAGLYDLVEGWEYGFSGRLAVRLALRSDGIEDADDLDAAIQARRLQRLMAAEARAFGRLLEERERERERVAREGAALVGIAVALLVATVVMVAVS